MKLQRVLDRPILSPRKNIWWESDAVFNAAAIHDGKHFHLFYRGVTHKPQKNRSSIGHAWSEDGIHFTCDDEPVLKFGDVPEETIGVEDPRITKIGDKYYLVYCAYNGKCQLCLATSTDLKTWKRQGILYSYDYMGHNKNGGLFPEKIGGRYALIHRPMGVEFNDHGNEVPVHMWISYSADMKTWEDHKLLIEARRDTVPWEYRKIGIGGAPIKTDAGWLVLYHAVCKERIYRLGLVLLDKDDPTKILKRTDEPIFEPQLEWELKGDVANVVFSCGTVLMGDELWVYYGGADTVIGLAKMNVREFLKV